jgi:hypothetical protein
MTEHAERPLRVLHYPTDVGGNPGGLAAAERRLGLDSTVAVVQKSLLEYPVDIDLDLGSVGRWQRLGGRMRFCLRAMRDFDVIHFNFGQSMLPQVRGAAIDLPLLRAAGKRLFMTFQGCDVRQTGYCRSNFAISCCGHTSSDQLCTAEQDANKARVAAWATRCCHRVFCLNPDLLHVVPEAEFMPYASVDPRCFEQRPPSADGPIRILHAPTNRAAKGSEVVLAALEDLSSDFDIEILLVENIPHAEALLLYREADLLIDQLKVGWYGALAVELMAMGKPVVSYIREDDLQLLPQAMVRQLPVVSATSTTLTCVLRDLLSRPQDLARIGQSSRAYVERWHDPRGIARRLATLYEDPTGRFWEDGATAVAVD